MKSYGAIRKLLFIVVLSILGSYCIGSDRQQSGVVNSLEYALQVSYSAVASVGLYCQKLWSELVAKVIGSPHGSVVREQHAALESDVVVQMVDDDVNSYRAYCTDDNDDCQYNVDFFTDTSLTGKLDEDPGSHYEIADGTIDLLEDNPREDMIFNKYSGAYRPASDKKR